MDPGPSSSVRGAYPFASHGYRDVVGDRYCNCEYDAVALQARTRGQDGKVRGFGATVSRLLRSTLRAAPVSQEQVGVRLALLYLRGSRCQQWDRKLSAGRTIGQMNADREEGTEACGMRPGSPKVMMALIPYP